MYFMSTKATKPPLDVTLCLLLYFREEQGIIFGIIYYIIFVEPVLFLQEFSQSLFFCLGWKEPGDDDQHLDGSGVEGWDDAVGSKGFQWEYQATSTLWQVMASRHSSL